MLDDTCNFLLAKLFYLENFKKGIRNSSYYFLINFIIEPNRTTFQVRTRIHVPQLWKALENYGIERENRKKEKNKGKIILF
jgi:hypothetical protein